MRLLSDAAHASVFSCIGCRIGSRDELIETLGASNVLARRYFDPGCQRMESYRSRLPEAGHLLPHTERLTERFTSLPTGTAVGPGEISTICDVATNGSEVRERWELPVPAPEVTLGTPSSVRRRE